MIGTAGQFIYDLNCIKDARKQNFDILLILGYTSSSVWGRWYPKKAIVITNMDGLEWKRSKYSKPVQKFLEYAEKLAVKYSDHHIADSLPIQDYLEGKYKIQAKYISYGAEVPENTNDAMLTQCGVSKGSYFLLIARMEPENHIEMILDGLIKSMGERKILVIGGINNHYGKKMTAKFANYPAICFLDAVYDTRILYLLRTYCSLYFHGHSVGGTNPSLLEAMASGAIICAHDNMFNHSVLGNDAFYFNSEEDIARISVDVTNTNTTEMVAHNLQKIREEHSWEKIITAYEEFFIQSYQSGK